MEIIQHDIELPHKLYQFSIFFLGDIHEGNANSQTKAVRKAVQMIKENGGYWVGMGDYIDCIVNSQDPRFDPVEISEKYKIRDLKNLPKKQMDTVIDMLSPIKDRCLGLVVGNHEEAYIKRHSFDVYDYLARELDAPKVGYVGDIILSLKHKGYNLMRISIALNHGDGGGGFREGYIINKVHDVFRWRNADLFIMGHLHRLAADRQEFIEVNNFCSDYNHKEQWYGCSGCFLQTYMKGNRNYFEHKGRPASDIGMLRADIKIFKQENRLKKKIYLHKIYI